MKLTATQQQVAMAALDVAAYVYESDAAAMRRRAEWRLAEQFDKQQSEARALARLIENQGDF